MHTDVGRESLTTFAPNCAETENMSRFLSSFAILLILAFAGGNSGLWAQDHGHEADSHDAEHAHSENSDDNHDRTDHEGHDHADHGHTDHDHADHGHTEEFVAGEFIIHHIADAHDIHLFGDVHIPLPVLLFIEGEGLQVFMSNAFEGHGHGDKHYSCNHGIDYTMHAEDTVLENDVAVVSGGISAQREGQQLTVYDFSITKSVFGMLFILSVMLWMFISIASSYKKNPGKAPKGMANALEPLILFIRDEIAKPSIGDKADKFMPFLLTVFFFIFFCNLLGLVPFLGGFNITGTIGVTVVLATLVFLLTNFNGNKHYWGHLFWPPGVPLPVKFILVPIEVFSIIMKPAVLMIRLTANISAGHIIILAFTSLIFIFGDGGTAIASGSGMGIFSTAFMIFMYFLELLVAFLQAFVFTLLAAIYFGDATHDPAHH